MSDALTAAEKMNRKIHLVIPMAGAGSRFSEKGFHIPKPMIEIHGRPFFFWAAMSVKKYANLEDITFAVLEGHKSKFGIDHTVYEFFPNAEIISIPHVLPGPVFTCLEASKNINDTLPVVFNDCDHMFSSLKVYDALNHGFEYDGGLLTFESCDPRFSYVRFDSYGNITGTEEKNPVSKSAVCGAYIFRNINIFRNSAEKYVRSCPYSECFMSGVYNVMCADNLTVKSFSTEYNVDFGTPEEYERAKDSKHFSELM